MLSRAKSLLLNTALAVTLLAGAVAVAAETGVIVTERPPSAASSVAERPTPEIEVKGNVKGLYPGAEKSMKVRVFNRLAKPVVLVSVRARVGNANHACTRENLRVTRFKDSRPIKAMGRARVRVSATMQPGAPDACQGARFPIAFRARVTGQRR